MIALENYTLRAALLIAGPPSGPGRAATARAAADQSRLRLIVRLTPAELAQRPLRAHPGPLPPRPGPVPAQPAPGRLGERAVWTDPPGV